MIIHTWITLPVVSPLSGQTILHVFVMVLLAVQGCPSLAAEKTPQSDIVDYDAQSQRYLLPDEEIPTAAPQATEQPIAVSEQQRREQALWRLLAAGQLTKLRSAISTMQTDFPEWRPSRRLLRELEKASQRRAIASAITAQDHAQVIALKKRYPNRFQCAEVHHLWALADAQVARGESESAYDIYAYIIGKCAAGHDRLVTLYKAERVLLLQRQLQLVAIEDERSRPKSVDAEYQSLRYRLYLAAATQTNLDAAGACEYLSQVENQVVERRDAAAARLFAWNSQARDDASTARMWFERAATWSAGDADRIALARFYLGQNETARAQATVMAVSQNTPEARRVRAEIAVQRARTAYAKGDYIAVLKQLDIADQLGGANRETQILTAWSHYQLGEYAVAANDFEAAYRAQPDTASAQGLAFSLFNADQLDRLATIERELDGPLSELLPETALVQRLRAGVSARELHLEIDSSARIRLSAAMRAESQAAAALLWRSKSGDAGTSRLRVEKLPVLDFHYAVGSLTELSLQLDHVRLDSGLVPSGTLMGTGVIGSPNQRFAATTMLDSSIEGLFRVRHAGKRTLFGALGWTPSNGVVDPELQGQLGIADAGAASGWRAELARVPVRESILSYSGLRDPFTGQGWGRVLKTGIEASGYQNLTDHWQLSGSAEVAYLTGESVKDNNRVNLYAKASRRFKGFGSQETNGGPYMLLQSYRDNLSKFTLGHGGYFSPQQLVQVGIAGHYLSQERRAHLWRGDVSIGYQRHKEAATPLFPLNPDGREYAEVTRSGIAAQLELAGVKQIGATTWQFGGMLRGRISPQYNDIAALIFVRYLISTRRFTLRRDLPNEIFATLY